MRWLRLAEASEYMSARGRVIRLYHPPLQSLSKLQDANAMSSLYQPPHLDHTAFPHIVDNIFAAADRAALLTLRGVSRAFRTSADARLADHLVCSWTSIDTPSGRHPVLQSTHGRVCAMPATTSAERDVVTHLPWASTPATCRPKVVDFADMFTPRSLSLIPSHFNVVRVWLSSFMHNPAITTSAHTIIVQGLPRTRTIGCVYEPWVVLHPCTRKVVYHVNTRFRAHPELLAQLRAPGGEGGVEELVVIVSPAHPTPRSWECSPLLHFLRCVVAAARRRPDMRITIVNPTALPEGMFPSDGSVVFGDDGVAPFVHNFGEYVQRMVGEEGEDDNGRKGQVGQWSFTNLAEYRERVGGRQLGLEMGVAVV